MQQTTDYKALYEEQQIKIELLQSELAQLKRLIFGSKTEQFTAATSPAQLSLAIQADTVAATSVTKAQKIAYTRVQTATKPVNHPVRMKLPDHLERKEIILEPAGLTEGCRRLSEEITEELEYEPGKLFVNRFVRPKYVSSDNATILVAPMVDVRFPKPLQARGYSHKL